MWAAEGVSGQKINQREVVSSLVEALLLEWVDFEDFLSPVLHIVEKHEHLKTF